MPLADYQKRLDDELQQYVKPYWEPLSMMAALTEEVGEVARIMNHRYGDKPKKHSEEDQDLGAELADVIYACLTIANSEGIDLDQYLQKSMAKLETRDKGRFEKK